MTAIIAPGRGAGSRGPKRRDYAAMRRSFTVTFILVVVLAAFVSLKTSDQIAQTDAPFLPSVPQTFSYEGKDRDVYLVPLPDGEKALALVKPGRQQSDFVDPANPGAGTITWQGSWRTLSRAWVLAPAFQNYVDVWNLIDFPRLLFNTIAISLIGMIGVVTSCTLVAY